MSPGSGSIARSHIGVESMGGLGSVRFAGQRPLSAKAVLLDRFRRQTASPTGPAPQTAGAPHIPIAGRSSLVDWGRGEYRPG